MSSFERKPFGEGKPHRMIVAHAAKRSASMVEDYQYSIEEHKICESPIEEYFLLAVLCELALGSREHNAGCVYRDNKVILRVGENHPGGRIELSIYPQATIQGHRVDFAITIPAVPGYMLVVECDGHEFHERTKAQAKKDRSFDRDLQLAGATIFRFTGSELWNDPMACVEQVFSWAIEKTCF